MDNTTRSMMRKCDESKCLSTGLMPSDGSDSPIDNPLLFNCYAQGPSTLYPYLCADDYVGVRIDNEAVASAFGLHYYTCCPPEGSESDTILPVRECLDPKEVDSGESAGGWSPTKSCQIDSPSFPYGREMTRLSEVPMAYMCCNVEKDHSTLEGTAEIEKVMYPPINERDYGEVPASQLNSSDAVASAREGDGVDIGEGDTELSTNTIDTRFLVTSPAYRSTIVTQFIMSLMACAMASLLIVSIGRSVYLTAKNNDTPSGVANQRRRDPQYSAFNIYLIFLAIPDLTYNLFMLGIATEEFSNGWIPENDALITISATTNQYVNAIIAREVLLLLRNTKDGKQYSPLSFKKAWIQFTAVTLYATILGIFWMYVLNYSSNTTEARSTEAIPSKEYSLSVFYLVVVIIPGIYMIWVCFEIWHKELLPKKTVADGDYQQYERRDVSRSTGRGTDEMSAWSSFRKAVGDPRDSTNNTNITKRDEAVANANNRSLNPNAGHGSPPTPNTTSTVNDGHLNDLVMSFLRIILVFFLLWLPGMILYYIGYQTDRNASAVLHNIGMMLFSLHAIASNGMAFTKLDVKKSIQDLWKETLNAFSRFFPYCQIPKEESSDSSATPKAPIFPGKYPVHSPKRDIEMQIQEEPSARSFRNTSTPSVSRVVTVQHKVANIGGIQMSQLTTHSISSFNSTSHHVEYDEITDSDSDSDSDAENEYLEFAIPGPRMTRSSKVIIPGTSSHSKESKSNTKVTEKPMKASIEKRSSGSLSRRSKDGEKSSKGGRRSSETCSESSDIPKEKMKKRNSNTKSPDLKGRQSPTGSRRRRISASSTPGSDSPIEKWENFVSSQDVTIEKSPIGPPKQRRGSASDLLLQKRRNSANRLEKTNRDGSVQRRRNSIGSLPVIEQRKSFKRNDIYTGTSSARRTARRRSSGSHLCKLNASNSPSSIRTDSKSPITRRKQRRSSDTNLASSKSSVSQPKKKFTVNNSDLSQSPSRSPTILRRNTANTSILNKSPAAEMKKKIEKQRDGLSIPVMDLDPKKKSRRGRLSGSDKNITTSVPNGSPERKNSGSSSRPKKSPGTPTRRRLSTSDKNIGIALSGPSKLKLSGHAEKSPELSPRRRTINGEIFFSETSPLERKTKNIRSTSKSPGQLARNKVTGIDKNGHGGFQKRRTSGFEKNIGIPPFGLQNKRTLRTGQISKLSAAQQNATGHVLSDSSGYTMAGKMNEGVSNSKSLSFDGTVTDNSMPSSS